jgi:hypothetical protein
MPSDLLSILREYIQLRELGKTRDDAVQRLRARIDLLPHDAQRELAREIRIFEGTPPPQTALAPNTDTDPQPPVRRVKPLAPRPEESIGPDSTQLGIDAYLHSIEPPRAIRPLQNTPRKQPCPRCTHLNGESDAFCARCGYFLQVDTQAFKTIQLTTGSANPNEYFDPRATLVLFTQPREGQEKQLFSARPQDLPGPVIVGRSDMQTRPDIDLGALNAGKLGVSRQHLSITYNGAEHTLTVRDLKSANGTHINGQRLYPHETRILRQSDELRLGRLALLVVFHM